MQAIVAKILGQWRGIACQRPKLGIIALAECLTGASPVCRYAT